MAVPLCCPCAAQLAYGKQSPASEPPVSEVCMLHAQPRRIRFRQMAKRSLLASWFLQRSGVCPASGVCNLNSCGPVRIAEPDDLGRRGSVAGNATAASALRGSTWHAPFSVPVCVDRRLRHRPADFFAPLADLLFVPLCSKSHVLVAVHDVPHNRRFL